MKDDAEVGLGRSFVYTEEDNGALLKMYMRVNPIMRRARRSSNVRWFRFLGVLWVVAFLAFVAIIWRGSGSLSPGWLFQTTLFATLVTCMAAFAGGIEALPRLRPISLKALGRRMPSRRGSFAVEVVEGWIRLWSEDSDESLRLAAVDEVVVEGGHVYLLIDQTPRMQIPERGFGSQTEYQAFCEGLRREIACT